MSISRRKCVLKWVGFVVSLCSTLLSGLATAFNVFSMEIKETFSYTQSQVELVSSIGLIGLGLSFLHSITMDKFGYKVVYVLIIVTGPVPCIAMYLATIFKSFFSNHAGLVGLFLLIGNLNTSFVFLQTTQIGISNFPRKFVGKVLAVYIGITGLGKVFFCGFHELFFVGDLGRFFLALGFLWTLFGVLCFFLHRPLEFEEEETAILGMDEDKCNDQMEGINDEFRSKDVAKYDEFQKRDILKSAYFHMMFWSSFVFYGCFFTFMDNLTVLGESAGLDNPQLLIYLLSAIMTTSRLLFGVVYDLFPSDKCGFLCLYLSYVSFTVAMVIGLTWFNASSVFLMTFLVGVSVAGGNSLPLTLLARHFGRKHYSAMLGGFQLLLVPTIVVFQTFVGYFYDIEITGDNPDNRVCYGSHCFRWTFVILLCVSLVVYLVQLINYIYIKHTTSA